MENIFHVATLFFIIIFVGGTVTAIYDHFFGRYE